MHSGWDHAPDETAPASCAPGEAYEEAGVGPADFDVVELHDASAPGEIIAYEYSGSVPKGDGGQLVAVGRHQARRSSAR